MKGYARIAAAILASSLAACSDPPPQTNPRAADAPASAPQAAAAAAPPTAAKAAPGGVAADRELSNKVKQALQLPDGAPPVVSSGAVEVAASNRVVTLYGTVDAPSTKERAALVAMGVDGVRSVVNNLVVVAGS